METRLLNSRKRFKIGLNSKERTNGCACPWSIAQVAVLVNSFTTFGLSTLLLYLPIIAKIRSSNEDETNNFGPVFNIFLINM